MVLNTVTHTKSFDNLKNDMVTRKGVYPYSYMNSFRDSFKKFDGVKYSNTHTLNHWRILKK